MTFEIRVLSRSLLMLLLELTMLACQSVYLPDQLFVLGRQPFVIGREAVQVCDKGILRSCESVEIPSRQFKASNQLLLIGSAVLGVGLLLLLDGEEFFEKGSRLLVGFAETRLHYACEPHRVEVDLDDRDHEDHANNEQTGDHQVGALGRDPHRDQAQHENPGDQNQAASGWQEVEKSAN
jgi:hypothetical protein